MAQVICNTSPLQNLHQVGLLRIIPALVGSVLIPPAVDAELAVGRSLGLSLPEPATLDWLAIRAQSGSHPASFPQGLDAGEVAVLALAMDCIEPVVILDGALARAVAQSLGICLTGTLGLLLDAK